MTHSCPITYVLNTNALRTAVTCPEGRYDVYIHVGLINTAVTISELLEARDARFRAWS